MMQGKLLMMAFKVSFDGRLKAVQDVQDGAAKVGLDKVVDPLRKKRKKRKETPTSAKKSKLLRSRSPRIKTKLPPTAVVKTRNAV